MKMKTSDKVLQIIYGLGESLTKTRTRPGYLIISKADIHKEMENLGINFSTSYRIYSRLTLDGWITQKNRRHIKIEDLSLIRIHLEGLKLKEQQEERDKLKAEQEKKKRKMSELELIFLGQVASNRLPNPEQEYEFHDSRKWRLDFAWPNYGIGVEIHGGTWTRGRHNRPQGMNKDFEKIAHAQLMGWQVLQVTGDQVRNGFAIEMAEKLIDRFAEA